MKKIGTIICGMAALLLCLETVSYAQGINGEQIMQLQYRRTLDKETRNAESRMENSIADLKAACDLTEQQVTKLQVAAKGAIKSVISPTKERLIKQAERRGFKFDPDAVEEKPDDNGEENPNAIAQRLMMQAGATSLATNKSNVDKEKIWVNAVDKVLTDEQKTKWATWNVQRDAFTRKAAVFHMVALADQKLLLSQEQREALSAYVDERFGDSLVANFGNNAPGRAQIILAQSLQVENGEEMPDGDEALNEILTESQVKLWKRLFAPRLNRPIRKGNLRD